MTPPKATILCIDNHQNGLLGRKMLLEKSGFDVLEATRGDEGFNLFLSHSVDAVVLEYQIPGMNGAEVAAKMKRVNAHVPIMLLSACCPLQKNRLRAVDTFLSKSQPPTTFLSALTEMLGSRPKTFFDGWLDHWKQQNAGGTQ
jgi:response regulator RpfG family c-di-GMP phosphodiesterase